MQPTAMSRSDRAGSAEAARRRLNALATWLEANGNGAAVASQREGVEEAGDGAAPGQGVRGPQFNI